MRRSAKRSATARTSLQNWSQTSLTIGDCSRSYSDEFSADLRQAKNSATRSSVVDAIDEDHWQLVAALKEYEVELKPLVAKREQQRIEALEAANAALAAREKAAAPELARLEKSANSVWPRPEPSWRRFAKRWSKKCPPGKLLGAMKPYGSRSRPC